MKSLAFSLSVLAGVVVLATSAEPPLGPAVSAPDGGKALAVEPFVIFRIGEVPVKLRDDYGVMLINAGNETRPSPRFLIAMNRGRTLMETADLAIAAQALKLIPKGSSIRWYDSCSVPRSWGLPDNLQEDFEAAMKRAGLKLLEDPDITCYCEQPAPAAAPENEPARDAR